MKSHTPQSGPAADLAVKPQLERFHTLVDEKARLLEEFSQATQDIQQVVDAEDYAALDKGVNKRQDVISRVNLLDKKIEEALFVLKMECVTGRDEKTVQDALKRIEDIVAMLVDGQKQCLSRVRAKYDADKARILAMQAQRKVSRGYNNVPGKPETSRFVDMQN